MSVDVRTAYGSRAQEYTAALGSIEAMAPQDRKTITDWSKSLDGPVIDAGSGPGHWTKYLHDAGVAVEGVDIVPEFVASARDRFPEITFRLGTIKDLPATTGSVGGLLSWYSIIHIAPTNVPAVLREFARCLKPGGSLLLGFFAGEDVSPFPHAVTTAYFWPVSVMGHALEDAGFAIVRTRSRTAPGSRPHADIVAQRPIQ